MFLAIDIGNTTISCAVLKGARIAERFSMETPSGKERSGGKLAAFFRQIGRGYPLMDQAVICSVVPPVSRRVSRAVQKQWGLRPLMIGEDIQVPLANNYRKPEQIGQDRLVVAYAARRLYGAPTVIIDFGTAITFDAVSPRGVYEGGLIVPGIRMSAESLFQKTSLLPAISPTQVPRHFIGKDTEEGILSGIFYGYGTMCAGLIDLFQKKYDRKARIIVTGGHTHLMRRFIRQKITRIDKDLVFHGMRLLLGKK